MKTWTTLGSFSSRMASKLTMPTLSEFCDRSGRRRGNADRDSQVRNPMRREIGRLRKDGLRARIPLGQGIRSDLARLGIIGLNFYCLVLTGDSLIG